MNSISTLTEFQLDLSGFRHLVCAEGNAINVVIRYIQELEYKPKNLDLFYLVKEFEQENAIAAESSNIDYFDSMESLIARLREILSCAYMGTRFYAVGSQQFIWDLKNHACSLGLGSSEIVLSVVGDRTKRVFCSTCHGINTQVTTNIFNCLHCSLKLEVWSHYSQLKNAYLGVCANAEEV
ncbi:MAG: dimethylamine monooxygenase subunit DmmA family protein [Cyanobacteria bacterium P01_A01_bin.40]